MTMEKRASLEQLLAHPELAPKLLNTLRLNRSPGHRQLVATVDDALRHQHGVEIAEPLGAGMQAQVLGLRRIPGRSAEIDPAAHVIRVQHVKPQPLAPTEFLRGWFGDPHISRDSHALIRNVERMRFDTGGGLGEAGKHRLVADINPRADIPAWYREDKETRRQIGGLDLGTRRRTAHALSTWLAGEEGKFHPDIHNEQFGLMPHMKKGPIDAYLKRRGLDFGHYSPRIVDTGGVRDLRPDEAMVHPEALGTRMIRRADMEHAELIGKVVPGMAHPELMGPISRRAVNPRPMPFFLMPKQGAAMQPYDVYLAKIAKGDRDDDLPYELKHPYINSFVNELGGGLVGAGAGAAMGAAGMLGPGGSAATHAGMALGGQLGGFAGTAKAIIDHYHARKEHAKEAGLAEIGAGVAKSVQDMVARGRGLIQPAGRAGTRPLGDIGRTTAAIDEKLKALNAEMEAGKRLAMEAMTPHV